MKVDADDIGYGFLLLLWVAFLVVLFCVAVPVYTDRYEGTVAGECWQVADDGGPSGVVVVIDGKKRLATGHVGVVKRLKAGETVTLREARSLWGNHYGLRLED